METAVCHAAKAGRGGGLIVLGAGAAVGTLELLVSGRARDPHEPFGMAFAVVCFLTAVALPNIARGR